MPKQSAKTEPEAPDKSDDAAPPPSPADDGLVRLEFRGLTFTVPRDGNEWDVDAWIALLRDHWYQTVEYQLSATNQWSKLRAVASKRSDLNEFLAVFGATVRKEVDFS